MFYANEIRNFNDIPMGEESRLTATEFEFDQGLVEKLSLENFETEGFEEEYQNMVRAMLDSKGKAARNHGITAGASTQPHHRPDGSSKTEHDDSSAG